MCVSVYACLFVLTFSAIIFRTAVLPVSLTDSCGGRLSSRSLSILSKVIQTHEGILKSDHCSAFSSDSEIVCVREGVLFVTYRIIQCPVAGKCFVANKTSQKYKRRFEKKEVHIQRTHLIHRSVLNTTNLQWNMLINVNLIDWICTCF